MGGLDEPCKRGIALSLYLGCCGLGLVGDKRELELGGVVQPGDALVVSPPPTAPCRPRQPLEHPQAGIDPTVLTLLLWNAALAHARL
jgi:hypothetical protein